MFFLALYIHFSDKRFNAQIWQVLCLFVMLGIYSPELQNAYTLFLFYYLLKTCHVMWVIKLEAASSSNSINQPQRTEGRWKRTFLEHPGNLYSRLGPWDRSPAPAELAVGLWGCFQCNGVFPLKTFVPLKEGTGLAACRLDLRWHLWTSEHQCLESQLNHLPVC